MRHILERRPSPAMIVALIALITAMAGSAYGAAFLTKKKFQNVGVTSVTYTTQLNTIPPSGGGPGTDVASFCPPGAVPIGGGIRIHNDTVGANSALVDSHPRTGGWFGTVRNTGTQASSAFTTVICAINKNATGSFGGF